jgi:hypothetical protein
MALKAPKGNPNQKKFAPQKNIAPGTYPARLVQLIDFGLQPQKPYKGKDKPPANEIGLTYELVDEFMKDEEGNDILDKPRWISETLPFFGLEADKAKSTQRYLAFDPDNKFDGDFLKHLGAAINVTIVNNQSGDKVYDNVATISAMRPRDAANCPELKNPAKAFDSENPDMEVFKSFPKWIQEKITSNLNFKGSKLEGLVGAQPKEDQQPPKEEPKEDNNPY